MATYAIGDIQGCHRTLENLLDLVPIASSDRLWLVGDLVNRGPRSLEVLRWAKSLGDRATVVLGNHDLHLLSRYLGIVAAREDDTLGPVLSAPDRRDLIEWLRTRPFLRRQADQVLVHAGLLPLWTSAYAEEIARAAEEALSGSGFEDFVRAYRGKRADNPRRAPSPEVVEGARVMTRIRACDSVGLPIEGFSGPPEKAPAGAVPWFDVPKRRSHAETIVFGHWAALGLRNTKRVVALDTGCVWGRWLTAVRLEDRTVYQVPFAD